MCVHLIVLYNLCTVHSYVLIQNIEQGLSYLRNNGRCFKTLYTLPKPPPSVDGGWQ